MAFKGGVDSLPMGFFGRAASRLSSNSSMSASILKKYGSEILGSNGEEIDALMVRASKLSTDEILRMPKEASDVFSLPENDRAFDGIFSAVVASGRLDAVISAQDRISAVTFNLINRNLQANGFDNGPSLVAIQTLTALFMRDWIDRQFTDAEIARSRPPQFVVEYPAMRQIDYDNGTRFWRVEFGRIHPDDADL